jgi:hypothetical protein
VHGGSLTPPDDAGGTDGLPGGEAWLTRS